VGNDIGAFFRTIALVLAAMLPIVNPLGSAPIFLSMTPGASSDARATLARRVATNSFLMLTAAMLVGSYVLSFFGLSLPVIKIAGGLLVISTGWHLISADQSPDAELVNKAPAWGAEEIASRSFYPLTFPLTVGPGSISIAITLGAGTQVPGTSPLVAVTGIFVSIILLSLAVYFSYRYASRLLYLLGDTGTVVFLRLSAFILLSIGVQIFCDGIAGRFRL